MIVAGIRVVSSYILKVELTDLTDWMQGRRESEDSRIKLPPFWAVKLKEEVSTYEDRKGCENKGFKEDWGWEGQQHNFECVKSHVLIRHPSGNVWNKKTEKGLKLSLFSKGRIFKWNG